MNKLFKKVLIWILIISLFIEITPVWALTKEENIYAKLNSDGTINNTYINEHLYDYDTELVEDKSFLKRY